MVNVGDIMPKFFVRLAVERIVDGVVYAENEKEARKMALSWSNICDEETVSEDIIDVIGVETAGE